MRQAGSSALHPQNTPTRLLFVSSPADPDPAPAAGRLRGARREQDPALPPRGQGSAGFLSSALNSVGGPETQVSRRETRHFPALLCKERGHVWGWGARGVPGEQPAPLVLPGAPQQTQGAATPPTYPVTDHSSSKMHLTPPGQRHYGPVSLL